VEIITARLQKIIEAIILEEQSGFRKGRSCANNIFILKQLIEEHREFHLLFIDYVKAFDREEPWNVFYKRRIPYHLIAAMKNMYKGTKLSLITNCRKVLTAGIKSGFRQGCNMSPILFNLYLDHAIRQL